MSVPEKDASCNRVSSLPFPHGKSHAIMNQTSKRKDHAMKKQKLLFVCHGNICRSTMAEFVMKDLVQKAGLADVFTIDSAACRRDEIGSDTHWGTKQKLRGMGVPFTPRHARQITSADYAKSPTPGTPAISTRHTTMSSRDVRPCCLPLRNQRDKTKKPSREEPLSGRLFARCDWPAGQMHINNSLRGSRRSSADERRPGIPPALSCR